MSIQVFGSTHSLLVGDITKNELFSTNNQFHQNYLDAQTFGLDQNFDLDGISLKILFGTWCHDSAREIPKLLRILEEIDMKSEMISLIGLNYQKNEPLNRGTILEIKKTPTIIFYRYGEEIGRIEESPKSRIEGGIIIPITLEENISFILKN